MMICCPNAPNGRICQRFRLPKLRAVVAPRSKSLNRTLPRSKLLVLQSSAGLGRLCMETQATRMMQIRGAFPSVPLDC